MTLGTFLQAIISLIFIYLILALLASELQEYLATLSEARAKRLKESIRQMLGESSLKCTDREKSMFKVLSLSYRNGAGRFLPTWESQYSLQDELSIRNKQGLQMNLGNKIIEKDERFDVQPQCWIEGRVISPVTDPQHVFAEGSNKYVWRNVDREFFVREVTPDPQNPDKGFVRASRCDLLSNKEQLHAGVSVWIDKLNSLNRVIDVKKPCVKKYEGWLDGACGVAIG